MSVDPTQPPFEVIASPDAIAGLLTALEGIETVAIDTEADSFHHFHHKVCLLQIALADRCYIVDPLAGLDLAPLLVLLAKKRLIFHDAGYDLRMLLADFDFRPQNEIFDTMLAARLVGRENVGLSALLEDILDIRLSKHSQRANWAQRPIPEKLLLYAAEDIRHLARLADCLAERLSELGRLDWHREFCQYTIAQTQLPKTPQDPEKNWRIRGTFGLAPRPMAFVRALWQWRQNQADRADLSPFRIMHNEQLLELALWAERQKEIRPDKLPRLPRHCKGARRGELLEALVGAHRLDPEGWPKPLPRQRTERPDPGVLKKTDRLKAECQKIADTLGLSPQVIASRKSLQAAVNTHADTEEQLLRIGWMKWQVRLLLPSLCNVLNTPECGTTQETLNESCNL